MIDLHVHSTASDGTLAPAEIARRAADFSVLALTDHDNADGVPEFLAAAADAPGLRLAGVELSIEAGPGFDRFHLLALGIDPANARLRAFLRRILEGRNARNERISANFARLGIPMTPADLAPYAHGEVLARPHFAAWLSDHGYASSKAAAFEKFLLPDSPAATRCYEDRWHPPQEETFDIVHGAGGVCVMAHPKYWRRTWKTAGVEYAAAEKELARLAEAGLDGIEALYQANTPEENVAFTRIADKLGLAKTAGSDFHGANKPTIPLGMQVADEARFLEKFLAARDRRKRA